MVVRISRRKFVSVFVAAVFALCLGAAIALAATDDVWNAGANSSWSATSGSIVVSSSFATVTCTVANVSGSSTGASPDVGILGMNVPSGSGCRDNLGGTDTVAANGNWSVQFASDTSPTACPSGTGNDETSGSDCLIFGVPAGGIKMTVGGLGNCVVTFAPSAPFDAGATMSDPGGATQSSASFNLTNVPFTGCGSSGTVSVSGTYILQSPNGGVVTDNS
jgi:hypothetical protein